MPRTRCTRSDGVIFDGAWVDTIATVNLSPETHDAAKATRPAWRCAYEGQPATAGDVCVARLIGELDTAWTVAA